MERRRAEILFARALELPAGPPREAFLAGECAGDERLAESVRSLLRAESAAAGFLETRAIAPQEAVERSLTASRVVALRRRSATSPVPEEESPPVIPGYRVERRLGGGGLGVVYAAHDEKLNRRVALKVLRRSADVSVRRRILDEARKAAALDDPAIVTVFSVLDEADPPAIVMEFIEGFPLDRFAAELSFVQKARLLREVARGLGAAHARGLVHRDLKPDNILVGPEMRPRILDFGLALTLEEVSDVGPGFAGTPLYASPEQVRGETVSTASDVFSFGSLMFKVLTGSPPFGGDSVLDVLEAIATTPPPFLRDVAVGVPEDLQAITLACLAWNPADRPTAAVLVVELGRFLAGEPVRLKPRLYDDLLRRRVSEYSGEITNWEAQGIISREERDQLQVLHRRLLADEDHWIIDARRLTLAQTVLYTSTWVVVVAAVLLVWLAREDLSSALRWLAPVTATLSLLGVGVVAERRREKLAAASFLAGAALSLVPTVLSLLAEFGWLGVPRAPATQLFGEAFTNQQFLAACLAAFLVSAGALARLRLTGFAWTSAVLGVATYLALWLDQGWLDWRPYKQALVCLPLLAAVPVALAFERAGRVRWSSPYHWIGLLTLLGAGGVIAWEGPTLELLGVAPGGYFDAERLRDLSLALNGGLFLGLMFLTERASSLDLRRAARVLEMAALVHVEGALFASANSHRADVWVRVDVGLYLAAALLFLGVGAWRGRWRMLVGALLAVALGSYLLVDLRLVPRAPFILGMGGGSFVVALLAFVYLVRAPRAGSSGRSVRVNSRNNQARE